MLPRLLIYTQVLEDVPTLACNPRRSASSRLDPCLKNASFLPRQIPSIALTKKPLFPIRLSRHSTIMHPLCRAPYPRPNSINPRTDPKSIWPNPSSKRPKQQRSIDRAQHREKQAIPTRPRPSQHRPHDRHACTTRTHRQESIPFLLRHFAKVCVPLGQEICAPVYGECHEEVQQESLESWIGRVKNLVATALEDGVVHEGHDHHGKRHAEHKECVVKCRFLLS